MVYGAYSFEHFFSVLLFEKLLEQIDQLPFGHLFVGLVIFVTKTVVLHQKPKTVLNFIAVDELLNFFPGNKESRNNQELLN